MFVLKNQELQSRSLSLQREAKQFEKSQQREEELQELSKSIESFASQLCSGLANAGFTQRRKLVELLIDRVVVKEEEVEIRYVIPTNPEGPHYPFCHLQLTYLKAVRL